MKKIIIAMVLLTCSLLVWAQDAELPVMPDFTLPDANGVDVNLYETINDSTIVIVDFWATWCGPCCQALPHLNDIHNKYPNVHVLAVTTDGKRTMKKAIKYVEQKGYTFTVLMDSRREVQKLLEINAIPETFIIGPDRKIHDRHVGHKKGDEVEVENHLQKLLKELDLM